MMMGIFRLLRNVNKPLELPEQKDAYNSRITFLQSVMKLQREAHVTKKDLARLALIKVAKG